jgi:aminocarboxymuconate-semialdehyde decarboxylase
VQAVLELRRCMLDLGLRGVQIGSHIDMPDGKRVNLNHPSLNQFYEVSVTSART